LQKLWTPSEDIKLKNVHKYEEGRVLWIPVRIIQTGCIIILPADKIRFNANPFVTFFIALRSIRVTMYLAAEGCIYYTHPPLAATFLRESAGVTVTAS